MIVFLNGQSDTSKTTKFESTNLSIAVIDEDDSEISRGIVEYLKSIHSVDTTKHREDLYNDRLFYQDIVSKVVINKGSGEAITGTFNLDTSTGALTYTDGYNEAIVIGVPNSTTIYIAVAPGTYGNFSAFANMNPSGTFKHKEKTSVTFEKGKIYNLGNVNDWDGF